ncbi:hypothetical protein KP509_10G050100 [Ceratopteris richardii]|uniref:adenylate kinase n=1 Tax=Ceratopteris richardii TaxID=49495 RepID=A0A8T2U1P2_CERRI|nr:hypothetical protein KP509_10G050100 [Ceratopteris richardii]
MTALRHTRKLCSTLLSNGKQQFQKAYSSAAAMRVQDFDYWELPLPVLQDTHGQKTGRGPQWIFLGSRGVKKATYAGRLAKLLNVPHISMGSLLREEALLSTPLSKEIGSMIRQGMLVPDDVIFSILSKSLEQKIEFEESGFVLDGFPRNIHQAEILDQVAEIDLVVNMKLRDGVIARHIDRSISSECGCPVDTKQVESQCCPKLKAVATIDSTMSRTSILRRQQLLSSQPVEQYYRKQGKLLDFEVSGGIVQTWPRLLSALRLEDSETAMQELPV